MRSGRPAFTLAEVMVSIFVFAVAILTVMALAQRALSSGQKATNLGTGRLVAQSELAKAIYAAQFDIPMGNKAQFLGCNSSTTPWKTGRTTVGTNEFTYALYAQTLPNSKLGGNMGDASPLNHLKKVDIIVWWWDGAVQDRAGQGRLSIQASRVVNEQD